MSSERTSMFSQTCERLREYLKDRGPLGGQGLIPLIHPTLNLFPTPAAADTCNNNVGEENVSDEMTIFYGGRIIVLQNVPPHKANQVMRLATSFATSPQSPSPPANLGSQQLPHAFVRDLSQTRSRSLTRFFEKRKDRMNARAPYTLKADKSWLGLASQATNLEL
ncbi:hypothetical protein QQ045_005994 [Rhodiola kirilowii]